MLSYKNPLQVELRGLRRRIQLERVVKGIALLSVTFLLASIVLSFTLNQNNFSDSSVFWARLVGGLILGLVILRYLALPALVSPSDQKIARFIEERFPALYNRVTTAVELRRSTSRVHPQIRALIERDALRHLRLIERPKFYFRESLVSLVCLAASALILFSLFWAGPAAYRYSIDKLLRGWYDDSQLPLYAIQVTPGNTKVVRHADIEIRATLVGFSTDRVNLVAKYLNQPAWEEAPMRPDPEGHDFVFLFFDARDRIDYYVEADGIESDRFTILVSDAPSVENLEITLDFPRHTGLAQRVQAEDGDIRALTGTRARFRVRTDQEVEGGLIRLENGGDVPLSLDSPRELTGSFVVERNDFYRIHLLNRESVWSPASDEYLIEALIDQPPKVSFVKPGRDRRVTNLEEIFTEIKAEDDYGLRRLSLRYSINGEEEQSLPLGPPRGGRSVTASHTFYLEEYDLVPGDFVSYYAEATDALTEARTDIYFLEVQPYEREFYQSQQASGAAGAGGGEDLFLSRLQKEIIAATFNIIRDKERLDSDTLDENVQTVALMQQQLQQQAQAIIDRIERRGLGGQDPMFGQLIEHMKEAAVHMESAAKELSDRDPEGALPPEQRSFQQLLRAESLFKEIQMSMGGSSGGGGGSSTAEELADMVDLELDKTKNQYETLQQNREQNREQALDEAAQKLKELAQRQQQEVERKRRQAQSSSSGGGSSSQQDLVEEVEELARQLERLSRQEREQSLNEVSRQLQQAARDLRRAQGSGNPQEAQMQAQRALERLQQAQQSLSRQQNEQLSESIQELSTRSRDLAQRQEEIVERIDDLEFRQAQQTPTAESARALRQEFGSLVRDKFELQQDVQNLESDLHQTAKRMASKQPEASRKLKQAGVDIRDQRIPEKMEEGTTLLRQGLTSWARQREQDVAEHLQNLAENVEAAEEALVEGGTQDPAEQAKQALGRLGNLVENLESLEQRAAGRDSGEPEQSSEQRPGEQGSPSGEPGEQQPGEAAQEGGQQQQQGPQQPGTEGQASNQQGRPSDSAGQPSGRTSPFANSGGINPQQVQRELQERIQDAEQIRNMLRGTDPASAREVESLARLMRQLDAQRLLEDPEEIDRLRAQIIEGFRELELSLYRSLRSGGDRIQLAHEDEVPPQLREFVEEYFRSLATRKR